MLVKASSLSHRLLRDYTLPNRLMLPMKYVNWIQFSTDGSEI